MPGSPMAWFKWVIFGAGIVACLAVAFGASRLAAYSWAQVVDYQSPYVAGGIPPELRSAEPTPGTALAKRVVVVIVDGLRDDVSRSSMPTLNTLRTYGTDVSLSAPQPSLSYPNWTTILSGASPTISGVTTNKGPARVAVPTIMDVARDSGRRVGIAGTTDFQALYGVTPGPSVSLRPASPTDYLSGTLVDDAIRIAKATDPEFLVVYLPDVDEAGHLYGGASDQYRQMAGRVDADIARLVAALQADATTFVLVADHGHTAPGGHGGWESEVVSVPGIFSGAGVVLGKATGGLDQVAPTIATIAGLRMPAYAESTALRSVVGTSAEGVFASGQAHHVAFDTHYVSVVRQYPTDAAAFAKGSAEHGGPDGFAAFVTGEQLGVDRQARLPIAFALVGLVVLLAVVIGVASWRALVSGLVGTIVYYALYNGLYFGIHHYTWSLSAFNTEAYVTPFMNARLAEAAVSALIAVAVAAFVYPYLRRVGWGPQDRRYLSGWLSLGPATLLVILGTLALQVAWFVWWWGATITWVLPDFWWAFKYDLDLVQMTAVGAACVLAPVVTYLIGRYHPKVRARRVTS